MAPKAKKANKPQNTTTRPGKTATTTSSNPPPPPTTTTPNWPALNPLIPSSSLSISTVIPSQILTIPHLFTSTLCSRYVSFLSSLPLITTPLTKSRDLAVRVNDRFQIDDAKFAEQLWSQTALKDLILDFEDQSVWGDGRNSSTSPSILGLNPNIRVYRYRPGQFFDQHYDDSNNLSFNTDDASGKPTPAKTTWTLLIYLSACEGGETVFYPERQRGEKSNPDPVSVSPEVGLGLLHRHGEKCMLHEGRQVKGGEKWVLRSDLVVAR